MTITDRTRMPWLVLCRRPVAMAGRTFSLGGWCTSHADCRADYWRRADATAEYAEARGMPVRPKSRRKVC